MDEPYVLDVKEVAVLIAALRKLQRLGPEEEVGILEDALSGTEIDAGAHVEIAETLVDVLNEYSALTG